METRANQYPSLTCFPVDFEFDQGYDVMSLSHGCGNIQFWYFSRRAFGMPADVGQNTGMNAYNLDS